MRENAFRSGAAAPRRIPRVPQQKSSPNLTSPTRRYSEINRGGSPKSRQRERGCVNSVYDKGEGVKKSEFFADDKYILKPPVGNGTQEQEPNIFKDSLLSPVQPNIW